MKIRVVLALALFTSTASAAPSTPPSPFVDGVFASSKIAPGLRARWVQRVHAGLDTKDSPRTAIVRLRAPLTRSAVRAWARAGIAVERLPDGGVLWRGDLTGDDDSPIKGVLTGVRMVGSALQTVVDDPRVLELVSPSPEGTRPGGVPDYGAHHDITRVSEVISQRLDDGTRVQGTGTVLCDIDSAIDLYHPQFFRLDAGYYDWIDVNGNARFDFGIDAVDLDANGTGSTDEIAKRLGGQLVDASGQVLAGAAFDPRLGWVYVDIDGSNAREFGPTAGFTAAVPAFGEPLFRADDANNNGVVDVGEKLMRLGSSKILGIWSNGATYERGLNLLDYAEVPDLHGTGVGGALVGGERNALIHGVAPDADLLVINGDFGEDPGAPTPSSFLSALQWAEARGADVILHEYGTNLFQFADGSSAWEQLIDDSTARGVVHATATHNFAERGDIVDTIAPGATLEIPLESDDLGGQFPSVYALGQIRWRDPVTLTASLVFPSGTTLPLVADTANGNDYLSAQTTVSARATVMTTFYAGQFDPFTGGVLPLPRGDWTLRITNEDAVRPAKVYVTVTDESSYSIGFYPEGTGYFDPPGQGAPNVVPETTIAWPSTADSALSVGATEDEVLTTFSGRGPRIDGALGVDVVSPHNPYVAAAVQGGLAGRYLLFSGTSGALPQVAAAAALYLQMHPSASPDVVKDAIRASSRADALTGVVPNAEWGAGHLDVHQLLFDSPAFVNTPPTLLVDTPATVLVGVPFVIDGRTSVDADGHAMRMRVDVDYDGVPDVESEYSTGPSLLESSVAFLIPGDQFMRIEIEDILGATAAVVRRIRVVESADDAGVLDAGIPLVDAGGVVDGGVVDAGATDGGAVDGGAVDGGVVDAGAADGGVVDAGAADGGVVDGGIVDAGAADGGVVDAGVVDAGAVDSGTPDAGVSDAGTPSPEPSPESEVPQGCTCGASGPDAGTPLFALLGTLALAWRRRRRRAAPNRSGALRAAGLRATAGAWPTPSNNNAPPRS